MLLANGHCVRRLRGNGSKYRRRLAECVCRSAVGPCDIAETCDGVSHDCPSDTVAAETTICREAVGLCDVEDTCDGVSAECPEDELMPTSSVCRPSAGDCDVVVKGQLGSMTRGWLRLATGEFMSDMQSEALVESWRASSMSWKTIGSKIFLYSSSIQGRGYGDQTGSRTSPATEAICRRMRPSELTDANTPWLPSRVA